MPNIDDLFKIADEAGVRLEIIDGLPTWEALPNLTHQEAVDRFLAYPGIAQVANHPKLLELRADPEVSKLLANGSYFRLLRHEKIVALASDPEFAAQIKKTDFDKALDYALKTQNGGEPKL